MRLMRLIYHSVAAEQCGYEEYQAILSSARFHNAEAHVTGMLVFGQGRFLQLLEGDDRTINATYNRIVTDSRHEQVRLIEAVPISRRDFSNWSMKAVILDDRPVSEIKTIILRYGSGPEFEPELLTPESARSLIQDLSQMAD